MRAMVHQARHLFAGDPDERAWKKHLARADALAKKQPQKVGGRQVFLRDLAQATRQGLEPGEKMSEGMRKSIMRKHTELYKALPPEARASYETEAARSVLVRQREIDDDRAHHQVAAHLRLKRLDEERLATGLTHRGSMSRFSDEAVLRMGEKLSSEEFSQTEVAARRRAAMTPPVAPPPATVRALDNCPVSAAPPAMKGSAPWLRPICHNRAAFRGHALLTQLSAGGTAYLMLYATQNPLRICFMRLTYLELPCPSAPSLSPSEMWRVAGSTFLHNFTWEPMDYITDEEVVFEEGGALFVLPDLCFMPPNRLVSDHELIRFKDFVAQFPSSRGASAPSERKPSTHTKPSEELMEKHPWLKDYLENDRPRALSASDSSKPRPPPEASGEAADDALIEDAWRELQDKRRQWEAAPVASEDFHVVVRGGAWTAKKKGVAADSVCGQARPGDPRSWCKEVGANEMASFSFAAHGEAAAATMAHEWVRRMQFYYELREARRSSSASDTGEPEQYVPSAEWVSFLSALPLVGATRVRAQQIDALRPGAGR